MGLIILALFLVYSFISCLTWGRKQNLLHRLLAMLVILFAISTEIQLYHIIAITPPSALEFSCLMGMLLTLILGGVLVVFHIAAATDIEETLNAQKQQIVFEVPETTPTKYCTECSKSIVYDALFCSYCGTSTELYYSQPPKSSASKPTIRL